MKEKLTHFSLAVLLSCGLLMPVLIILMPGTSPARPLLIAAALCLALEAASLHRVSSLAAGIGLPLAASAWLFSSGSLTRVSDVLTALTLRLRGQQTALPLVAPDAVLFLSLLAGLLSWLITLRRVSYMPALMLCIGVMMTLWFTGSSDLIPWLLPALAAVFVFILLDRHPSTSPIRVFLFASLLVLAAWLLTPAGGVTVEPMKDKADELRQMILDRLFYTEPRDVFSISSEGYYPQGTGQLGGTPELNDRPVMQVSAPRTVYLRGVVMNEYDGRAWRNTTGGRRNLWQSLRLQPLRDRLFDQSLPAVAQTNSLTAPASVSVRMLSSSASTLFVPQRVRELLPGGGLVPYFSNASEIFVTRNLLPGDTWTVSAPLFRAGDPGISTLVDAASVFPDENWDSVLETYTQLPSHLEQPVYDLASEIVTAAASPYDRAFAIQSWLSRNCRYTLDVSPHPSNVDFVTRFLLETREGYCTYFASALTVLCRMAGLPARYVEGYLAEPGAQGEALVTGRDAHAWTEVYFRGFGWLTFDASPHQRSGSGQSAEDGGSDAPQEPEPTEEPDGGTSEDPEEDPEDNPYEDPDAPETEPPADPDPDEEPTPPPDDPSEDPEDDPPTDEPDDPEDPENDPDLPSALPDLTRFWWILPLLLLLALILRILQTRPESRARRAAGEEARMNVWAQAVMDDLAAEGYVRGKGETLLGFTRRIDGQARFSVSVAQAGERLSLLRYSETAPAPADTELLRDTAVLLHSELRVSAKAKALLRRIFLPLSRRNWMK